MRVCLTSHNAWCSRTDRQWLDAEPHERTCAVSVNSVVPVGYCSTRCWQAMVECQLQKSKRCLCHVVPFASWVPTSVAVVFLLLSNSEELQYVQSSMDRSRNSFGLQKRGSGTAKPSCGKCLHLLWNTLTRFPCVLSGPADHAELRVRQAAGDVSRSKSSRD